MKDGIIRKRFNNAVKEQSALPEGKNTLRILGARDRFLEQVYE